MKGKKNEAFYELLEKEFDSLKAEYLSNGLAFRKKYKVGPDITKKLFGYIRFAYKTMDFKEPKKKRNNKKNEPRTDLNPLPKQNFERPTYYWESDGEKLEWGESFGKQFLTRK